jgi:hypothetical protein
VQIVHSGEPQMQIYKLSGVHSIKASFSSFTSIIQTRVDTVLI